MKKSCFYIAALFLSLFASCTMAATQSFWANGGTVQGADTPVLLSQGSSKSFSISYAVPGTITSAILWLKAVDDNYYGNNHCTPNCTDGFFNDGSDKASITSIEGNAVALGAVEIDAYGYYSFGNITQYLLSGSSPLSATVKATLGDFWYKNARIDINYDLKPVPVPAAVWLFGSALLGLTGIKRKSGKLAASM